MSYYALEEYKKKRLELNILYVMIEKKNIWNGFSIFLYKNEFMLQTRKKNFSFLSVMCGIFLFYFSLEYYYWQIIY